MEGDAALTLTDEDILISIHALRVEGDLIQAATAATLISLFLSTPSGWRATTIREYRRSARNISIHALRVEGDYYN